jgi:hypothetical protein
MEERFNQEVIKKALSILNEELNNNIGLCGKNNKNFQLLATSIGNLKLLMQRLSNPTKALEEDRLQNSKI